VILYRIQSIVYTQSSETTEISSNSEPTQNLREFSEDSEIGEYDYFSEHDILRLQLTLLQTLAKIYVGIPGEIAEIFSKENLNSFKKLWTNFLRDTAILFTQEDSAKYVHKSV